MTNLAIIGAGTMGVIHARSCMDIPEARVAWVVDTDGARASALADALGARATADLDEALDDPGVEAVIVAVPTFLHRAVAERAAARGKHIFCEKPIARTREDAEALIAACARAGVGLMVGHVVRFFPEYARIRDELQHGAIGQVGVARAARLNTYPANAQGGGRSWYADLARSGGPILDLMIHDLDTLRWYFGEAERVFARSLSDTPYQPQTDYALAIIRFANGVIAHVEASWAHSNFRTAIEITGEHGALRHTSGETAPIRVEQAMPAPSPSGALVPRGSLAAGPYELELRHFLGCLASGAPFLTSGPEALRSLELALAVMESARAGRAVHFTGGRPIFEEASR
ncbi:MAG: Gfo/Idh/MocA family protein [Thermomicrobiales bacterium]